ncbi:MAG: hypothetical protein JXR83_11790 [Deltaproteobacteria bacterium]|nr:hypothetical protein [Deltaproteobacteria bacterium]
MALWLAALAAIAGCGTSAVAGKVCAADSDCQPGAACVNGKCVGPAVCNSDQQCPEGQFCGASGLCETEPQLPDTCTTTSDCPISAYCNTALEQPTCVALPAGSCREDAQCPGQVCSALPGGVGRCVDCLSNGDCPSGQCLSDGTCAPGGVDAGAGRDAGGGRDAGSGSDDPTCGAEAQACCGSGSSQPTPCDSSSLGCARDFPSAGASTCWRRCSAVACATLEGASGWCHIGIDQQGAYVGSCQGVQAYTCSSSYQCQQVYPSANAECVFFDATLAYCFAMGCNWQADCGSGYYCSTYDGNLCLDVDLLGG